MAYQNVGTPRFYVNVFEWLISKGLLTSTGSFHIETYFTTSASNPLFHTLYDGVNDVQMLPSFGNIPYNSVMGDKSFIAFLGHNFSSADVKLVIQEGAPDYSAPHNIDLLVNGAWFPSTVSYDGFSIQTFDISHWQQTNIPNRIRFESGTWEYEDENPYSGLGGIKIGSIVLGSYYDMPHSPDLSLTMEREYGGIKTIETKGGASLSNSFYNGNPKWGSLGAWELSSGTTSSQALSRSGRRVWNLSFSYLDDGDVFGSNQLLLTQREAEGYEPVYTTEGYSGELIGTEAFQQNLLTHDNFFSQVIHKTNGGQLPFIFQPDGSNNNPDQFAICKFDQNSFKFKQVANGVYNVNLKIREVW